MSVAEWIQIGILVVLTGTLVVTMIQLRTQNRLLRAQVLAQRLQTYWRTYEPVSDAQLHEAELYPDDYMNPVRFKETYSKDQDALRTYIGMLMIYEYLAFTYSLKDLDVPDPVGYEWVTEWTMGLTDDAEFWDVHEWHRTFYPKYSEVVESFGAKRRTARAHQQEH